MGTLFRVGQSLDREDIAEQGALLAGSDDGRQRRRPAEAHPRQILSGRVETPEQEARSGLRQAPHGPSHRVALFASKVVERAVVDKKIVLAFGSRDRPPGEVTLDESQPSFQTSAAHLLSGLAQGYRSEIDADGLEAMLG